MDKKASKGFTKSPARPGPKKAPDDAAVDAFLNQSPLMGNEKAMTAIANANAGQSEEEKTVYKTVNVKLNRRRYLGLKLIAAMTDISMQQYLAEAVDEILERNKKLLAGANQGR